MFILWLEMVHNSLCLLQGLLAITEQKVIVLFLSLLIVLFCLMVHRYQLRGFPSLLLFKGGIFQSQFRPKYSMETKPSQTGITSWLLQNKLSTEKYSAITSSNVAVWLAKHTNQFPRAVARSISISNKQLEYLHKGWHSKDPVLWLSNIFVALRIIMWVGKFFR